MIPVYYFDNFKYQGKKAYIEIYNDEMAKYANHNITGKICVFVTNYKSNSMLTSGCVQFSYNTSNKFLKIDNCFNNFIPQFFSQLRQKLIVIFSEVFNNLADFCDKKNIDLFQDILNNTEIDLQGFFPINYDDPNTRIAINDNLLACNI